MKLFKKLTATTVSLLLLFICAVTAFAAGTTVNGQATQVGDTVTYTLNMSDVTTPVAGIQMYIYYDNEYLELDKDSLSCDGFAGYMANADLDGEVIMNASEGVNGYDFTSKTEVISLTFTVLQEGSTDITYYISDLFDIYEYGPGDYLKTYTLTTDISVNGSTAATDTTPILDTTKVTDDAKGDFVNNEAGTGEIAPEDATSPSSETTGSDDEETTAAADDDATQNKSKLEMNGTLIAIIVVLAVILVGLVIAFVVMKSKKKTTPTDNSNPENKA